MWKLLILFFIQEMLGQSGDCPDSWTYGLPNNFNDKSPTDVRRRTIVAGQEATPHEYPWQVKLRVGPYLCGGSLIGRQWVLTAAHCYQRGYTTTVVSGLGRYSYTATWYVHEQYDSSQLTNDIALLRMSTALPCDDPTVRAIALGDKSNGFKIDECSGWLTGFGTLYSGGPVPQKPYGNHEVQTRIWDTDACNSAPETNWWFKPLPNTQLCGFTPNHASEDACQGDSGGPFIIDINGASNAQQYVQMGVTSYGAGCGSTSGIYTDVSMYRNWIWNKYSGAQFIKLTGCDKDHYYEGIVECTTSWNGNKDCQIKLPQCSGNSNTWVSTRNKACSKYSKYDSGCFADKGSQGFYAYQVCYQCENCISPWGHNSNWQGDPNNIESRLFAPELTYVVPVQTEEECSADQTLVPIVIHTGEDGQEMMFNINGDQVCSGQGQYENQAAYNGACCLVTNAEHTINCMDTYEDGWQGGYLEINGHNYCIEFLEGASRTETFTIGEDHKDLYPSDITVAQDPEKHCYDFLIESHWNGDQIEWKVDTGSCHGEGYGDTQHYNSTCCLATGAHVFQCLNEYGEGFHGGIVVVEQQPDMIFCSEFDDGHYYYHHIHIDSAGVITVTGAEQDTPDEIDGEGCDPACVTSAIGDDFCNDINCHLCPTFYTPGGVFDGGDCPSDVYKDPVQLSTPLSKQCDAGMEATYVRELSASTYTKTEYENADCTGAKTTTTEIVVTGTCESIVVTDVSGQESSNAFATVTVEHGWAFEHSCPTMTKIMLDQCLGDIKATCDTTNEIYTEMTYKGGVCAGDPIATRTYTPTGFNTCTEEMETTSGNTRATGKWFEISCTDTYAVKDESLYCGPNEDTPIFDTDEETNPHAGWTQDTWPDTKTDPSEKGGSVAQLSLVIVTFLGFFAY